MGYEEFKIEGRHPVMEAFRAGRTIDKLFVLDGCEDGLSLIHIYLHKSVNSISTTRAQLISKGIIYPIRYKELDFTVPEFSGFIQRLDEYRQWCDEVRSE